MHGILIIAHAPLASAMKAVAQHTYPEKAGLVEALDVASDMPVEETHRLARELLDRIRGDSPQALILTDIFGATPYNVALRLANGSSVRLLVGINVPMLWRALNYASEPLDVMASRAESGAVQGVMQVAPSRPQSQTSRSPSSNGQDDGNDQ